MQEFRAEPSCLGPHLLDEIRAHDGVVEARIIFHFRGQGQLPAGMHTLDQQGRKVRPRRVDGGGQPCRPGPDDDDVPQRHRWNLTQRAEECTERAYTG